MSNSGVPIVEDVAGTAGDIVETIEEAVNNVGDAISDVGEWVDDTVLQPVVDVTKDALTNELVMTVATITASVYAPWAIPLIQGASVAAQGGDIKQVLQASAKAYVAGKIGSEIGGAVGSSVGDVAGQSAGQIIGSATGSASVAAITGGDPVEAFIAGGALASVPVIMGESEYFSDINTKIKNDTATAGEIATYTAAQTLITSAVTGKEVNEELVAATAASAYLGGELLKTVDPDNNFSEAETALVMDMVDSSMKTYITGGNIQDAVMRDIVKYGSKEFKDYMEDDIGPAVRRTFNKYASLESKAEELDENTTLRKTALDNFARYENEYEAEVNQLVKKEQKAIDAREEVQAGTMTIEEANMYVEDYESSRTLLEERIDNYYETNLENAAEEYVKYEDILTEITADYSELITEFEQEADQIDEKLQPAYDNLKRSFVQSMDTNFNPEEYAEIAALPEDVDPYDHWLQIGQYDKLPTNYDTAKSLAEANEQVADVEKQRIYEEAITRAGIGGRVSVTPESAKNFFTKLDQQFGDDVSALREVDGATNVAWNQLEELNLLASLDNGPTFVSPPKLPEPVQQIVDKYNKGSASLGDIENEIKSLGYEILEPQSRVSDPEADMTVIGIGPLDEYNVLPTGDKTSLGSNFEGEIFTDPKTGKDTFRPVKDPFTFFRWNPETGQSEEVEIAKRKPVPIQEQIKKDPLFFMTTFSQADPEITQNIQAATGLDNYFFDISKNAIELAQNTNNDTAIKQATEILKTGDVDAGQNYSNVVGKNSDVWGDEYTPNDEDVNNVLGTVAGNPDIDSQTAINEYVDSRYVDIGEVREAASSQGYDISDEEAQQYVGQFDEAETLPLYEQQFSPAARVTGVETDLLGLQGSLSELKGDLGSEIGELAGTVGGLGEQVSGLEGDIRGGIGAVGAGLTGLARQGQQLQRAGRINTLLGLSNIGRSAAQQPPPKQVDPAKIGYLYDISGESIFATPQQEQLFALPYNKGGNIHSSNAELLNLLRNK